MAQQPAASSGLDVTINFLSRDYPEPLPLSLVEPEIKDNATLGARLALAELTTTGRLLGQKFALRETRVARGDSVTDAAKALLVSGERLFVTDLEPDDLLAVADLPQSADAIFINARSSDDTLRGERCRKNIFHTAPSWAMRADALTQYLTWKRWTNWFLLRGETADDLAYASALKRSAAKFRSKIAEERTITFDAGNRRTDTGHQQIQAQIPLLTQSPPNHDIVLVADTAEAFGEFLLWRTAVPKPVAGTHGLIAVAWHRSYEQYGGTQLQNRFQNLAKRTMTERDYLAWLAVRAFGEAAIRSHHSAAADIRRFLLSGDFELAGFKGQAMTFRRWDRQLRQPILLTGPRALVSMSPQDGFLHEKFLTDTLGDDEPESKCRERN